MTTHWCFSQPASTLYAIIEMFHSLTFISLLLCSYQGALAVPFIRNVPNASLAIARSINTTGFQNIVAADQARAKVLREMGLASHSGGAHLNARDGSSIPVTNAAVRLVSFCRSTL